MRDVFFLDLLQPCLAKVTRVENETNYLEYMTRRAEIMDELNQPAIRGSDGWEFLAERFSRGKKMPHTRSSVGTSECLTFFRGV